MRMETRFEPELIHSPSKESELKGVLKQNKVDEVEDEVRTVEPEKVIPRMNKRHALNDFTPLVNPETHFRDDHLQLCSHQKDDLQAIEFNCIRS